GGGGGGGGGGGVDGGAAGGGVGVDHIDGAVAVVRDVVVDDDQLAGRLGRGLEVTEATERATVEGDHDRRLWGELMRRRESVEAGQLAVMRCDDEGRGK